jgi:hypothetical protein
MDKAYAFGAAIAYLLFILLTSWLIMIGLDIINISVRYEGVIILLIAARFTYVLIKGNIVNE